MKTMVRMLMRFEKEEWRLFILLQLIFVPLFLTCSIANPNSGHPGYQKRLSFNELMTVDNNPLNDGIGIFLTLTVAFIGYKIFKLWKKRITMKRDCKSHKTADDFELKFLINKYLT
jgi:hypothetical protein